MNLDNVEFTRRDSVVLWRNSLLLVILSLFFFVVLSNKFYCCRLPLLAFCIIMRPLNGISCHLIFVLLIASCACTPDMCPRVPYCEFSDSSISSSLRFKCRAEWALRQMPAFLRAIVPIDTKDGRASSAHSAIAETPGDREAVMTMLEDVLARAQGQSHVMPTIVELLRKKIMNPDEPLVMQFAGDHGVGKTSVAKLISLALSLWSAPGWQPAQDGAYGDAMLVLAGSSYAGLDKSAARALIVPQILRHAKEHPFGIVLLDDMTAMDPEVVECLYPLLGRAQHFPEDPTVDLRKLIVIATTDFGQQGQTQNKTPSEIAAMVDQHFGAAFGVASISNLHTFPFVPINNETAKKIVAQRIVSLPCRFPQVVHASFAPNSLVLESFLADSTAMQRLRLENGHALLKMLDSKIDGLVRRRIGQLGVDARFRAVFDVNMKTGEIELRDEAHAFGEL
jgi:hypothetical protein